MFLNIQRNALAKEKLEPKIKNQRGGIQDAKGFSIGEIKKAGIKLTDIQNLSSKKNKIISIDTRRISIYEDNVKILRDFIMDQKSKDQLELVKNEIISKE